jgi:DNA polymerase/3'-5' exonuclease PolX
MFRDMAEREPGFIRVVNRWFAVKGNAMTGRYTQRVLPEGIKLDLFMATPDNFGLLMAIRTGSAEYSHQVLAKGWRRLGYESKGGILWKDGQPTYIRTEQELFDLLGILWLEPELREIKK